VQTVIQRPLVTVEWVPRKLVEYAAKVRVRGDSCCNFASSDTCDAEAQNNLAVNPADPCRIKISQS
jgi:hypothetical protein